MKPRNTRMIFVRNSFPYQGGSSTYLYLLFETVRKQLPEAECWNIVTPRMWETGRRHYGAHWPNPKKLPNVRTFMVDGMKGHAQVRHALEEKTVTAVLSKGRETTTFLKQLDSSLPVWHLTSTCSIVKNAVAGNRVSSTEHLLKRLRTDSLPGLRCRAERQAVKMADRILFHTQRMRFWYHTFYPEFREKMENEIFWDYPLIQHRFERIKSKTSWKKRPIDLLFVATDWRRGEKNFPLLKQLCRLFVRKRIMVIGFLPERLPDSVIAFDTMSQEDVVQAMAQTKIVACPSRYDEAPNVLFEAAIAGANIVCSKNCGNYQLAHEDLVARLNPVDFAGKIQTALQRHYPPYTRRYTKQELAQWLVQAAS